MGFRISEALFQIVREMILVSFPS